MVSEKNSSGNRILLYVEIFKIAIPVITIIVAVIASFYGLRSEIKLLTTQINTTQQSLQNKIDANEKILQTKILVNKEAIEEAKGVLRETDRKVSSLNDLCHKLDKNMVEVKTSLNDIKDQF